MEEEKLKLCLRWPILPLSFFVGVMAINQLIEVGWPVLLLKIFSVVTYYKVSFTTLFVGILTFIWFIREITTPSSNLYHGSYFRPTPTTPLVELKNHDFPTDRNKLPTAPANMLETFAARAESSQMIQIVQQIVDGLIRTWVENLLKFSSNNEFVDSTKNLTKVVLTTFGLAAEANVDRLVITLVKTLKTQLQLLRQAQSTVLAAIDVAASDENAEIVQIRWLQELIDRKQLHVAALNDSRYLSQLFPGANITTEEAQGLERDYLRGWVEIFLKHVLPKHEYDSVIVRLLVRELLTGFVLEQTLAFATPECIYQFLVLLPEVSDTEFDSMINNEAGYDTNANEPGSLASASGNSSNPLLTSSPPPTESFNHQQQTPTALDSDSADGDAPNSPPRSGRVERYHSMPAIEPHTGIMTATPRPTEDHPPQLNRLAQTVVSENVAILKDATLKLAQHTKLFFNKVFRARTRRPGWPSQDSAHPGLMDRLGWGNLEINSVKVQWHSAAGLVGGVSDVLAQYPDVKFEIQIETARGTRVEVRTLEEFIALDKKITSFAPPDSDFPYNVDRKKRPQQPTGEWYDYMVRHLDRFLNRVALVPPEKTNYHFLVFCFGQKEIDDLPTKPPHAHESDPLPRSDVRSASLPLDTRTEHDLPAESGTIVRIRQSVQSNQMTSSAYKLRKLKRRRNSVILEIGPVDHTPRLFLNDSQRSGFTVALEDLFSEVFQISSSNWRQKVYPSVLAFARFLLYGVLNRFLSDRLSTITTDRLPVIVLTIVRDMLFPNAGAVFFTQVPGYYDTPPPKVEEEKRPPPRAEDILKAMPSSILMLVGRDTTERAIQKLLLILQNPVLIKSIALTLLDETLNSVYIDSYNDLNVHRTNFLQRVEHRGAEKTGWPSKSSEAGNPIPTRTTEVPDGNK